MFLSLKTLCMVIGGYVSFCKFLGPWFMRDREPYSLKIPMLLYNSIQILTNSYIFYLCYSGIGPRIFFIFSDDCNPLTEAKLVVNVADQASNIVFYYQVDKLLDLFDTVFFVLRKKTEHVTTTHVFHHSSMLALMIITDHLNAKEEMAAKLIALNTICHIISQFHYMLCGINNEKYLHWKKYITIMVIIEDLIAALAILRHFLYCNPPHSFIIMWLGQMCLLIVLFVNYYRRTYWKKNKTQ